ncbi:MAG: hypothetical protein ACM34K_08685 [Bacillota bacterium]
MLRIFTLLLIISLVCTGCNKKQRSDDALKDQGLVYSIRVKTFSDEDSAKSFAEFLNDNLKDNKNGNPVWNADILPADTSAKQKKIAVEITGFRNSFSAGMQAYKLFTKGILKDYTLRADNQTVYDQFANLFFVGRQNAQSSVYKYNIKSGRTELFWSNSKEMVVDLSLPKDEGSAFFITASEFGRKTIFPYINNVRLYRINLITLKVEKLKELGNGIQLFSSWTNDNTYRVLLNVFDKRKSTFVVQTRLYFNAYGNLVKNEKVTYDIVKEKYPVPAPVYNDIASTDKKYKFVISNLNDQNIFSLVDNKMSRKDIYSTTQTLNSAEWWDNGKYLIFSTYDPGFKRNSKKGNATSGLFVYSAKDNKILSSWYGGGYKNFLLRGDLLFFDDGFNNNSKIIIYNLKDNKAISPIIMRGGCGIRNIPVLPY